MKIELIPHPTESEAYIGWKMSPENVQDDGDIAIIRNMQFFGMDHTNIQYKGLSLRKPEKGKIIGNIENLKWAQEQFNCDNILEKTITKEEG